MDDFRLVSGRLHAEDVPLGALADAVGTPAYVYSKSTLLGHLRRFREAFAPLSPSIHYAVKANSNLAVLALLAREGAGFDVVSRGEIFRVLQAGGRAETIDFAGVGKRKDEIAYALETGIDTFNVESEPELEAIGRVARSLGSPARVALRINPDVDPKTHVYITTGKKGTKFGLDVESARRAAASIAGREEIRLVGLHAHLGSQILEPKPYVDAIPALRALAGELRRDHPDLSVLNLGGGFGIHYRGEEAPAIADFARALVPLLQDCGFSIRMEPGRLLVGNAGVLLTRVLYVKRAGDRRFVICDAAMNDLIRPSLYAAYHAVVPERRREGEETPADVVGPICESGDFLAKDRPLPPVEPGDLLVVRSAGAYGFSMASNYNARPRPPEVLVDGSRYAVVRARETLNDLIRGETAEPRYEEAR